MTRKRFVKQLMSQGIQRNEANITAWYYNNRGMSYQQAFVYDTVNGFGGFCTSLANYAQSVIQVSESFKIMAEVIKNANKVN